MASETWEQDKINLLKYSNEESHRITMESIEIGLLWLMKKKAYEDISISEIVKKSGVSRSAFYKNYRTKEDVLVSILERNTQKIMGEVKEKEVGSKQEFWEVLFESIAPYAEIYQEFCRANLRSLLYDVYNKISFQFMDMLLEKNEYYMIFFSGGVSNIIIHWTENGMKESPREMARIMNEVI